MDHECDTDNVQNPKTPKRSTSTKGKKDGAAKSAELKTPSDHKKEV